jgi:E3 ubiquitin-protein ligase HUWE1
MHLPLDSMMWQDRTRFKCLQSGGAAPAGPTDMDFATMLATFPAEVREEVLLTSDESMLATLTPALLAEAQVPFPLVPSLILSLVWGAKEFF